MKKKKKVKLLTLDEVHASLLVILEEFDRICREHNLCYTIAYGTMIGAVRHKGFIPWDDDIDVFMPRPDYEKLYAGIRSGEIQLNEHFYLSEDRGKKALYPFLKLLDDRYAIKSWSHIEVPNLYIDIFPLDGAPEGEKAFNKLCRRRVFYSGVCALARWAVPDKKWTVILRFLLFPFYLGCAMYGSARGSKKLNHYALKNDYEKSDQCSLFNFTVGRWLMDKTDLNDIIELPFENITVKCIANYDKLLRDQYGDYMQLPPENKRITHGVKVWLLEE